MKFFTRSPRGSRTPLPSTAIQKRPLLAKPCKGRNPRHPKTQNPKLKTQTLNPKLKLYIPGQVAYRLTVDRRLGYLFERFPAFTQTFCARELAELYRQGATPPVFSIRHPTEDPPLNIPLEKIHVSYLPDTNSLEFKIRTKLILPRFRRLWAGSGDLRDKGRFREALYLGPKLNRARVSHVHVHFAGLASRTAWWIKRLFGITYSFTGHANDIFCSKPDQRVTLGDLIGEASFVVAVSDFGANWLRRGFPEAAGKVCRVYNGLDLSTFKPSIPGPKPVRLLSVGRLIEKKGFVFLVEACRLLGDGLVEAWQTHRCVPQIPPVEDLYLYARRMVAQTCLYGVDKNPFAVDLAKLSLRLATLARDHPFTFLDHELRCGDSLVGLTAEQINASTGKLASRFLRSDKY